MKFIIKHGSLKYVIFVLIGLIVSSIEGFLLPQTIRLVIGGLENGVMSEFVVGISFGVAGFLVLGIGAYFYQYSIAKLLKNFNINVKSSVYEHHVQTYQKSSLTSSSDVLSFIQNDIKLLESNYIMAWITAVQTIFLAAVASVYILSINPMLGLVFIVFALLTMISPKLYQKKIENSAKNWSKANEEFTKELTEDIKGVETIIGYQREKTFFNRLKESIANAQDKNIQMTMAQAVASLTAYVSSHIFSLIPFFIGGLFVFNGWLDVAALVAVFIASDRIANPLSVAAQSINKLSTTIDIRKKLLKIEEENKVFKQTDNFSKESILPIEIREGTLEFESKLVLDGINMEIQAGEKVLLLGESGSGKTSILNLIQQHIFLTDGLVTYDGKRERNIRDIKQNISYIRQTPMIFNDTLEFNLTLGEDFELDDLHRAIKLSGLTTVVQDRGLEFILGENGQNLSGGQNQRVEIARAIMRKRELLIADEVTAALDKETAKGIHNTLLSLPQAIIEVSHHIREENFSNYNRVYEIENRKVRSINYT